MEIVLCVCVCVCAFAGDNVFISVATIHNLTSDVQKNLQLFC